MMSGLEVILEKIFQSCNPATTEQFEHWARPYDPADYEIPQLDDDESSPERIKASEIPKANTQPDASWNVWPPRILNDCREPLAEGAPDIRGVWECYEGRMRGHVERVEQAGNRLVITTGGLVHDMICDGTFENGVHDTAGIGGRPLNVAASFESGEHQLRPFRCIRVVAASRRLDHATGEMIWRYGIGTNRLRRLTEPPLDHPATRAAAEAAGFCRYR